MGSNLPLFRSDGFLLQWNGRMGVVVWGLTTRMRRKLSMTVQIKQQSPGQPDGAVGDWKLDQRDPAALFLHPFFSFIRFAFIRAFNSGASFKKKFLILCVYFLEVSKTELGSQFSYVLKSFSKSTPKVPF